MIRALTGTSASLVWLAIGWGFLVAYQVGALFAADFGGWGGMIVLAVALDFSRRMSER